MDKTELLRRVHEFANRKGLTLGDQLGSGVQGTVFNAKSQSEGGRSASQACRAATVREQWLAPWRWPLPHGRGSAERESYGVFMIDVNPGNISLDD
jgi:hypothetical protein